MPTARRIPRSEHPRPQLQRPAWLCLNGPWDFGVDAGGNGEALGWASRPDLPERIVVPFCPESRLSGLARREFMPQVWYARTFTVPAEWRHRRVLLHFGAVDYEATVWVNGHKAGFHRGGYTPFALEITQHVRRGANLLVVRAVDDTRSKRQPSGKQSERFESHGCLYTRTTGIWQTVWLEAVGRSYVRNVRLLGDPAGGRVHLTAVIDSAHSGLTLTARALAGRRVVGTASASPIGAAAACTIALNHVRRWDLDDPFLYGLELTLRDGDEIVDEATGCFGLRTISLAPPAILLNDRPVFQRLVLDQGFYPAGVYTAPRDADLKRDIALSQELGFNGARLHEKVFEERFLHHADRMGYLVWGEYADWGIDRGDGEAWRRIGAEWVDVIARDFNHPCIVGWCPCNEGTARPDPQMQTDVIDMIRALDPTRPVIDSSGYYHYGRPDVYDCHDYDQDPRTFAARHAAFAAGGEPVYNHPGQDPYAGQPFILSEYGGIWWNPGQKTDDGSWGYGARPKSRAEFIERYRGLTTALLKHPRMAGFCYTQLTDVEQEVNGLLTFARKHKFDPEVIAKINRQAAAIEKGNPACKT